MVSTPHTSEVDSDVQVERRRTHQHQQMCEYFHDFQEVWCPLRSQNTPMDNLHTHMHHDSYQDKLHREYSDQSQLGTCYPLKRWLRFGWGKGMGAKKYLKGERPGHSHSETI